MHIRTDSELFVRRADVAPHQTEWRHQKLSSLGCWGRWRAAWLAATVAPLVTHVRGHQTDGSFDAVCNDEADAHAKRAALRPVRDTVFNQLPLGVGKYFFVLAQPVAKNTCARSRATGAPLTAEPLLFGLRAAMGDAFALPATADDDPSRRPSAITNNIRAHVRARLSAQHRRRWHFRAGGDVRKASRRGGLLDHSEVDRASLRALRRDLSLPDLRRTTLRLRAGGGLSLHDRLKCSDAVALRATALLEAQGKPGTCMLCGAADQSYEHALFRCTALADDRDRMLHQRVAYAMRTSGGDWTPPSAVGVRRSHVLGNLLDAGVDAFIKRARLCGVFAADDEKAAISRSLIHFVASRPDPGGKNMCGSIGRT